MPSISSQRNLSADIRTVCDIADHFDRLRQTATAMRAAFGTRQRGYFSPEEDLQVRRLLISYTQARNALLELVEEFRDDPGSVDADHPEPFAVAFGSAIVLVQAARFLRDSWNDDPIVCRKLNEPEPAFGIPAGTYDAIQLSLTQPYHAWLLHHAAKLYDALAATLHERAAHHADLQRLLHLIDQRIDAVRVPKRDYAKARLQVRARQLIERIRHGRVYDAIVAIQESVAAAIGNVSVNPWHTPSLPQAVRDELHALLRPGDVMITRKQHAATNYFLPGFWPHGALYIGTRDSLAAMRLLEHENVSPRLPLLDSIAATHPHRVIEGMKDGILLRATDSPFSVDCIIVLRPQLDEQQIAEGLSRAFFHVGKGYDFDFDFTRSDRMVCTEVVYRAFDGIGPMRFTLSRRAGRMTLAAEDILRMLRRRQLFSPVACYCPVVREGLQCDGTIIDSILDQTVRQQPAPDTLTT